MQLPKKLSNPRCRALLHDRQGFRCNRQGLRCNRRRSDAPNATTKASNAIAEEATLPIRASSDKPTLHPTTATPTVSLRAIRLLKQPRHQPSLRLPQPPHLNLPTVEATKTPTESPTTATPSSQPSAIPTSKLSLQLLQSPPLNLQQYQRQNCQSSQLGILLRPSQLDCHWHSQAWKLFQVLVPSLFLLLTRLLSTRLHQVV